jgi:hypothetical protein
VLPAGLGATSFGAACTWAKPTRMANPKATFEIDIQSKAEVLNLFTMTLLRTKAKFGFHTNNLKAF